MLRVLLLPALVIAASAKDKVVQPAFTDVASAGPDYVMQGEFEGTIREKPFALQIIALGKETFDAAVCPEGLPTPGKPNPRPQRVTGIKAEEGMSYSGNGWRGTLTKDGVLLYDFKGELIGNLKRVERSSPTMGAKAPEGAVVLFDGTSVDAFKPGAKKTDQGLLEQGVTSKEEFGDCSVHVEFCLPFMPESRGQGRGNSGIYLAGRYEVQMLDSFGLNGENNECGGIYTVAKPVVNMCYPPLQWQTYDIDYTAPRFDETGAKLSNAVVTVKHNGVTIHEAVKLPAPTAAAPISKDGPRGPIHLQNHGNPVRYRNIWVVKKD